MAIYRSHAVQAPNYASTLKSSGYSQRRRDHAGNIRTRLPEEPYVSWWEPILVVIALLPFAVLAVFLVDVYYPSPKPPAVRIQRLDVGKIDVISTNIDAVATVTVNLAVFLEASDGKETTEMIYRNMNASVAADGFQFSSVNVADAGRPAENSTALVVAAGAKDAVMYFQRAHDLRRSAEAHSLMIDVSLKGQIDMIVRGKKDDSWFRVECRSINQSEIDAGKAPACTTRFIHSG